MAEQQTPYAIECRELTKTFGSVVANDRVNLSVRRGEILALLGENGSGKTTLMNMLSGIYHPDSGEILVDGRPAVISSPIDAMGLGIGMIHQHFKLVEVFSAMDNIVLGTPERLLPPKQLREKILSICGSFGLEIEPEKPVCEMSVSEKQTVEIIKVLYRGADILILDEPTAVLTPQETDELFDVIRRIVREKQMTVIIITHKLYEVMAISDRVGVMRQGRLAGLENTRDVNEKILASMMVGRPVLFDHLEKAGETGDVVIGVEDLRVGDNRGLEAVRGVSLSVRAGEVLGIAAIEGNGQSELLEAICGLRRAESGHVRIGGEDVTNRSPGEIRARGLANIPEDRLATGVDKFASVTDNLLVGRQRDKEFNALGFHQKRSSIERYASELYERFDIRGAGVDTEVGSMSGGNMQKVVVAREFSYDTPALVISQPTRGVDIGAMEFIHTRIIEKRNSGCAVLLSSADLDEVFRLSDRIITLYEGHVTGEFRADSITKEEIGYYMTGHRGEEAAE